MAKSPLYDHCDVVTEINKESSTVNVQVSFKGHIVETHNRFRYTSNDVLSALQTNGVPVVECLAGTYDTLDSSGTQYLSGEYVFSLVPKKSTPKVESKPATTKRPRQKSAKTTTEK